MSEYKVTSKGIAFSNMQYGLEQKAEKDESPFKFAFISGWTAMLELHDKRVDQNVLSHACDIFKYSSLRCEKLKQSDIDKFTKESFDIGWNACETFYKIENNTQYNELLEKLFESK